MLPLTPSGVANLTDTTAPFPLHWGEPNHDLIEDECEKKDDQSAYQQIPYRHAGKSFLGR